MKQLADLEKHPFKVNIETKMFKHFSAYYYQVFQEEIFLERESK